MRAVRNVRSVLIAWSATMLALGLWVAIDEGVKAHALVEIFLLSSISVGVLALNLRGGGQ